MKVALGARGGRLDPDAPAPSLTVDLGKSQPLELLYLLPVQRDFGQGDELFPRRFALEVAERADFSDAYRIYATGEKTFPAPKGKPMRFALQGRQARFVRLTVEQGHQRGAADVFALSELVVIADGEPVSFGAKVEAQGAMDVPDTWDASYLTDARTPLGIWQGGPWTKERGDLVEVSDPAETVSWTVPLENPAAIDRVTLFPYQLAELVDTGIFPDELTVTFLDAEGGEVSTHAWRNPLPGTSTLTPVAIAAGGKTASAVRVTGTRPWQMGAKLLHGLSEIEIWSGNRNLAAGRGVQRLAESASTEIFVLTDGKASERQILPVAAWLNQLHERARLEQELAFLQPIRQRMASESELNATWGSAVMLGLTFLIPVVIVERRRLISRNQLDQLRKRIASDLHDDIGSNLGSISLIARTARKDLIRLHGPDEVAEDLGEVESIARESSLAMRDIVWLLERRQDSIGDLVHRMRETAGRLLREMEYAIECDSTKTAAKLSLDAKRHLFLFYKEALHNVVKHSRAGRVDVRLWDEHDLLALEVRDDGIGLPSDPDKRPSAVQKLQDRARVLGGNLHIQSAPGQGTALRLTVKRSHLTAAPALS